MFDLLFASVETYRVHGAAHPSSLKARALALRMERLALAELETAAKRRRVLSRTPAESLGSERDLYSGTKHAQKAGGRRSGDDANEAAYGVANQVDRVHHDSGDRSFYGRPAHQRSAERALCAVDLPALEWRGDRVYFAGDERGYRTLAEALAAWRGRAA